MFYMTHNNWHFKWHLHSHCNISNDTERSIPNDVSIGILNDSLCAFLIILQSVFNRDISNAVLKDAEAFVNMLKTMFHGDISEEHFNLYFKWCII